MPDDKASGRFLSDPDKQLAELHAKLDATCAQAMTAVTDGGDPAQVFEAGHRMGVSVGMGLATAFAIKEMQLRDEKRAKGDDGFFRHHDTRAQAFDQLARALNRWLIEH